MILSGTALSARKLEHLRDLVNVLVARDLKAKYRGAVLGMVWAVLHPLLYLAVFYFVFQLVLDFGMRRFTSFAFTGLLAWTWFQGSLSQAVGAIRNNRELIRQPGFPPAILPLIAVVTHLINFLLALPILIAMIVLEGVLPTATLALLPIVMGLQMMLTLGVAYLLAALNVTFRDTQHILAVVLQLMFFATPIFYTLEMVPEQFRLVYLVNPMVYVLDAYRDVIRYGAMPEWGPLVLLGLFSAVLLFIGYRVFQHASYRFVEES